MGRTRPGGVCRVPALTNVPLSAQQHRHLPQAHAATRFHLITTRSVGNCHRSVWVCVRAGNLLLTELILVTWIAATTYYMLGMTLVRNFISRFLSLTMSRFLVSRFHNILEGLLCALRSLRRRQLQLVSYWSTESTVVLK